MSNKLRLPTNEERARYLDNYVPLQQLDNQLMSDEPVATFIDDQLAQLKINQRKASANRQPIRQFFQRGAKK